MKKVIGILGGISAASTARYYDAIMKKYYDLRGDMYFPEVVIYSLDFQKFTDCENSYDLREYIDYTLSGIHALERAGANVIVMAANSVHSIYHEVCEHSDVPVLSIVDVALHFAIANKMRSVLLLGIKHTMNGGFYQDAFRKRGITVVTPSNEDKDYVDDAIFNELSLHVYKDSTRGRLLDIISRYNVDGVILGCT
ncbi:MAG: amino acid racemase, partial [Planctomycetes bacterium]|nr:amino acid racemase [Planctomycetota bacterium]